MKKINSLKKTIIHIATFPPPYGGVTVANERLYQYLLREGADFLIFNFREKINNKKNLINIDLFSLSSIFIAIKLFLFVPYFFFSLKKEHKIILPIKDFMKIYYKAAIVSQYLEKEREYSVFCNHLGKDQIIFYFLYLLKYKISIKTYLHGIGIIERYDSNPALYKKLTNLTSTYMVASRYMIDLYKEKKDLVSDIRLTPPFIMDYYYNPNIANKENIILYVGSLTEVKNPVFFIEELNKAREKIMGFEVLFIGDGPLLGELLDKKKKYKLGNISFLGELSIKETEQYYEKSKYLVLPSKREPFGMVITEAMAKKVIPIVANIGGMPEIFSDKAGYVFELIPGALARILSLLEPENYGKMSNFTYQESLKYSESNLAPKWLKVLME